MSKKLNDYWGLKNLFKFDKKEWKIYNDTQETAMVKDLEGRDNSVLPGKTQIFIKGQHNDFNIPNNDTINFSDKSIYKEGNFEENFYSIRDVLIKNLKEGQIVRGLDFLDFHYKWTKEKKRFIYFIKYYILTKSWIETEKRSGFNIYDEVLNDWVKDKEFKRKRPRSLLLFTIPIVVFLFGAIFWCEHRSLFIGALIGGLATQIKEISDLVIDKTNTVNKN